jgi:hypothetical protein
VHAASTDAAASAVSAYAAAYLLSAADTAVSAHAAASGVSAYTIASDLSAVAAAHILPADAVPSGVPADTATSTLSAAQPAGILCQPAAGPLHTRESATAMRGKSVAALLDPGFAGQPELYADARDSDANTRYADAPNYTSNFRRSVVAKR